MRRRRGDDSSLFAARTADARTGGFSLIEVLCAVMLLGVSIVGLAEGLAVGLRSTKQAEDYTQGALLAAARIEIIRAEGDLIAGEESGEFADVGRYSWRQSIQSTAPEGLYRVRVDILVSGNNVPVYRLETLLFDRPIRLETETERRRRRGEETRARGGY